jgi:hypothetical protein
MALMALVLAALDSLAVRGMEFPAGMIHIALFLLYVPAATWFLTWIFALEDLAQGLALLVVWIALPGMVLAGLKVVGFTLPLDLAESWLPKIPS